MPNGDAAEAKEPKTEFTLPNRFGGTTVCIIVWVDTLAIGTQKPMTNPLVAITQNEPVGARAKNAYPVKIPYIETAIATVFLWKPFITDMSTPPARIPPWKNAETRAKLEASPR